MKGPKLLLSDPNEVEEDGVTSLMIAAIGGDSEIVRQFLDDPRITVATINAVVPEDLLTTLMVAGTDEVVSQLLDDTRTTLATINMIDHEGYTALMTAALANYNKKRVRLLLRRANPFIRTRKGTAYELADSEIKPLLPNYLFQAIYEGNYNEVIKLISTNPAILHDPWILPTGRPLTPCNYLVTRWWQIIRRLQNNLQNYPTPKQLSYKARFAKGRSSVLINELYAISRIGVEMLTRYCDVLSSDERKYKTPKIKGTVLNNLLNESEKIITAYEVRYHDGAQPLNISCYNAWGHFSGYKTPRY